MLTLLTRSFRTTSSSTRTPHRGGRAGRPLRRGLPRSLSSPAEGWKPQIERITAAMRAAGAAWPAVREIHYVISVPRTLAGGALALEVGCRQRKKNGEWRQFTRSRLSSRDIGQLPDPTDRQILATLSGGVGAYGMSYGLSPYPGSG